MPHWTSFTAVEQQRKKTAIVEELSKRASSFEELREEISKDLDPFDLISATLPLIMPPLTRKRAGQQCEKARLFWKIQRGCKAGLRKRCWTNMQTKDWANLESMEVLKVPDVARCGTPVVEILEVLWQQEKIYGSYCRTGKPAVCSIGESLWAYRLPIKPVQDIMRQDAGVDGDAQRISQLVWMSFWRCLTPKKRSGTHYRMTTPILSLTACAGLIGLKMTKVLPAMNWFDFCKQYAVQDF